MENSVLFDDLKDLIIQFPVDIPQTCPHKEEIALSLFIARVMTISQHLGTQVFYSNFPFTPGML